jgi:hypothetical protein
MAPTTSEELDLDLGAVDLGAVELGVVDLGAVKIL